MLKLGNGKLSIKISEDDVYQNKLFVQLGMGKHTETDEFSEKFQGGFDWRPTHFRKIILWILRQKCVISRQKCVCSLWWDCYILYDPISHEMHVVQQFNMVIG